MPAYLCHGFRWDRRNIRVFVAHHDLDDASPDWIIGRDSSTAILKSLHQTYPYIPGSGLKPGSAPAFPHDQMALTPEESQALASDDNVLRHQWSALKLLEAHDSGNTEEFTRPYAFVAHHVVRVDLEVNVNHHFGVYGRQVAAGVCIWFQRLRDDLQKDEPLQWYVVICDDQDRLVSSPAPLPAGREEDETMMPCSQGSNGKGKARVEDKEEVQTNSLNRPGRSTRSLN